MSRAGALGVATFLDLTVGEPPAAVHPVVWMGRLIDRLTARLPAPDAPHAVRAGAIAAASGAGVVATVAAAATRLSWPLQGVALWTLLSGRLLLDEVDAVDATLREVGLEAARARLGWLVSRDTGELTAAQVRAAAVQTLAENSTDSVTATLWWWSVAGLPGAAVHRWADTLDSRWGYRDATWTRRGRAAALLDDALAWLPARLTAALWRGGLDRRLRDQACRTPSPNGGWTMGAAALATGSRLEKPGAYVLHQAGREADADTVAAALRDARRVLVTAVVATLLVALARDLDDRTAVAG